jgi:hypothetical protein
MSEDQLSLGVLNRRTAIAAVRMAATQAGLNAEQLLDSSKLYNEVTALDVDDPGFPRRVAELVTAHATARGLSAAAPAQAAGQAPATQPAAAADDQRQWTDDDVKRASTEELEAAIERGQLTGLGVGPRRRRR